MSNIRTYEITHSEQKPLPILQKDTTDYILGGSLVMKNGKIDKVLFEGGYAQASVATKTTDKFAFNFYNQDHLGNNREVVDAKGNVTQVTNYYPFGAPYADATASKGAAVQPYKYNGKELDLMHGLNTYDYGARQHDPILARWDRIDPLCEKYYSTSPYAYCANNPVKFIDPDGKELGLPEEIQFALNHPLITLRIGAGVTRGAEDISSNASRFATRGPILAGVKEDRGSEKGAFRHALWQAQITSEFGSAIAKQVGDAHEDNPNIDMSQTIFSSLDEADQSVDLHNNIIGRNIGKANPNAGMQDNALKVLNVFRKEGLYEAKKTEEGYQVVRVKLSGKKATEFFNILKQLNNNGRTQEEQNEIDARKAAQKNAQGL